MPVLHFFDIANAFQRVQLFHEISPLFFISDLYRNQCILYLAFSDFEVIDLDLLTMQISDEFRDILVRVKFHIKIKILRRFVDVIVHSV